MSVLFLLLVARSSGGVNSLFFSSRLNVEGGTTNIISRSDSLRLNVAIKNISEYPSKVFKLIPTCDFRLEKYLENKIQIVTGQRVISVEQRTAGVWVKTDGAETFSGEKLITCIPPSLQGRIAWKPGLSPLKSFVQSSTPLGYYIMFALPFSKPYWEPLGLAGSVLSSGGKGRVGCEAGPVTAVNPLVLEKGYALAGFVAGKPALQWQTKSMETIKREVIENLSKLLGSWIHKNKGLLIKDWRGTGVSFSVPGSLHAWPAVRIPEGNLHFGGTETATSWLGSLEGGVQAGIRAGLEVLRAVRPQSLSAEDLEVGKKLSFYYNLFTSDKYI